MDSDGLPRVSSQWSMRDIRKETVRPSSRGFELVTDRTELQKVKAFMQLWGAVMKASVESEQETETATEPETSSRVGTARPSGELSPAAGVLGGQPSAAANASQQDQAGALGGPPSTSLATFRPGQFWRRLWRGKLHSYLDVVEVTENAVQFRTVKSPKLQQRLRNAHKMRTGQLSLYFTEQRPFTLFKDALLGRLEGWPVALGRGEACSRCLLGRRVGSKFLSAYACSASRSRHC
jgi:hypothetical protein